jgi:hypothetical protein
MNAIIRHTKLLLEFKAQLFNYQDSMNEVLIRSGLRLMEGYTLRFPDTSGTFLKEREDFPDFPMPSRHLECFLDLHTIHRYIQNCPGLSLFGPNKYWSGGDVYFFTVTDFTSGKQCQVEVTLQEPFRESVLLPFATDGSAFQVQGAWSLTLQLVKFGGHNQKAWQHYLDADYDARAVQLLNQLPKDFGLPVILRDYEFLQRVVTVYNQNKQQNKTVPLHKIVRQQMPAFRKQLLDLHLKLALLSQNEGQPLIYEFTDYSEFTPIFKLSRSDRWQINFRLWKAFFTI